MLGNPGCSGTSDTGVAGGKRPTRARGRLCGARSGRPLAPTLLEGEVGRESPRERQGKRSLLYFSAETAGTRGVVSGSEAGPVRLSFVMHDP